MEITMPAVNIISGVVTWRHHQKYRLAPEDITGNNEAVPDPAVTSKMVSLDPMITNDYE